jgi:predicted Holliday junction resolvase-like endonuclease
MSTLLVVLCVILLVAFAALLVAFRRLRRSIPSLVEAGKETAIREFKKRSGRTRVGTTVEQLVPYVREMPFDPSDMRILSGGPIDFVVFDGLCEGNVRELVFLDVKTGRQRRTSREQKQVQRCADLGRVRFAVFDVDEDGKATFKPSKRIDEIIEFVDDETRRRLRLPE